MAIAYQLRSYHIKQGELGRFVDEWRRHIKPARERYGFTIEGAWTSDDEDRFVWIIGYEGEDGFEAADQRYYGSPERKGMDPDPARLIVNASTRMMKAVG